MTRTLRVPTEIQSSAVWGPGGRESAYRYRLARRWGPGASCLFLMLNPSTATEDVDDPTVRRCRDFAHAWGFGALMVGNVFALRSTDPRGLYTAADPVGPDNDRHLLAMAQEARMVVCAWGVHGELGGRGRVVTEALSRVCDLYALRVTKGGQPSHPLYLPGGLSPAIWEVRRAA